MATELKLDKMKILTQLKDIQAMSGEWTLEYDADVDQLYFGVKKIPKGYFLFQVNDEINLFVDKKSQVKGMFVEYFQNNFLEHNKELKPVMHALNKDDDSSAEIQNIERIALEKELFFDAFTSLSARSELVTAVA
ncbi:MAG: hypothetical protein V4678_04320 [Patescibacteria group bacterium]